LKKIVECEASWRQTPFLAIDCRIVSEGLSLTGALLVHANPRSTAIYAYVQNDPSKRAAD